MLFDPEDVRLIIDPLMTVGPVQVKLMTDTLSDPRFKSYSHVPDPYFGGSSGFELVR